MKRIIQWAAVPVLAMLAVFASFTAPDTDTPVLEQVQEVAAPPAEPAAAGSYAHTWHSCQHSVAQFGSGQAMTSAQTWKYCYVIGVRVVSRSPAGSTVTQAWTTSTSSAKRNIYQSQIGGNVPIKSHHFVQDVFGTREYHTCWPGIPNCVAGLA